MNRTPIFVFAWIAFAALGFAREPVRLAISGDPAFAVEADLLTAELSKIPDVVLLERQQILKIANEQALHATGAADGIKLGRMLGADGLLILSRTEIDGRALLAARLVAVHPGVVIDEWTSTPHEAAEGRELAVVFSRRIAPLLPKLRVSKEDAVPVSVAGLFAAVDSPELRKIERELTWLLVHRLTQEPTIFVLERTRMEDMVLEKELAAAEPEPFLSGAVIVEGKLEERAGRLDLALGLRRSGEKNVGQANVTGAANDLPAFAEKIVSAILDGLKMKPTVQRWNRADEAAFYADQAQWAMDHRLIDLCIASAESAWALGRRDVDLARLRVIAYSLIATPYWPDIIEDSHLRGGHMVGIHDWELRGKNPVRDLAAAIRAMEISAECLSSELPPSRIAGRKFRPVAVQALYLASGLIKKHYLSGKYQKHAEQLKYLRSLAIDVCKGISKSKDLRPAVDVMEYWRNSLALESIATFAPYWYDSNEEVLAWIHLLFKSVPYGEDRDDALRVVSSLEEYKSYEHLPMRLVPWVVAWNPAETRQRQLDMIGRLKRLTESADFDDQLVGWASLRWLVKQAANAKTTEYDISWPQEYAAALAGKPTNASPHQMVSKGAQEFLWKYREKLATCHKTAASQILYDVPSEADRDYRLRYIRYIFESEHHYHWVSLWVLLDNLDLTEVESIEFYRLCIAARTKTEHRENFEYKENFINGLNAVEEILVKGHPQLKPKPKPQSKPKPEPTLVQPPASPPIIVTRYWYPSASAATPTMRNRYDFYPVRYADGKLWFVTDCRDPAEFLGSVALDSLRTEYYPMPPHQPDEFWKMSSFVTKDAVYLLKGKFSKKWDRHNNRWSSINLPDYPYSGRVLGDALYLQYEFGSDQRGIDLKKSSSAGSGILRLNLSDDSAKFLANSRRRPAETILDAREPYIPLALFSGAGGEVSVALEFPTSGDRKIFRTTAARDWKEVLILPNEKIGQVHFQYVKDGILAFMHPNGSPYAFFQAVFFGADGGTGQILLSQSKPSDPPEAILPGAPRWDATSKPHTIDYWNTAFDYCDGRLYQLKLLEGVYWNHKKNAEVPTPEVFLVVYTPDSRLPVSVPLKFQIPEENKAQIIKCMIPISIDDDHIESGPIAESLAIKNVERVSGMKVVPEGIVFFGGEGIGFWLLPAKELEARLQESRK